jgi:hypothetical protein
MRVVVALDGSACADDAHGVPDAGTEQSDSSLATRRRDVCARDRGVMAILRLEQAGSVRLPVQMPRDVHALAVPLWIAATQSRLSAKRVLPIGVAYRIVGAFRIAWFE